MKIIHVVNGNDVGGAMTQVLALVKAQSKIHNLIVISIGNGLIVERCCDSAIATEVFNFSIIGMSRLLTRLKKLVDKETIIHVHGLKPMLIVGIATLFKKMHTVATIHSDYKVEYKNRKVKQFLAVHIIEWAIGRIDRFIAVSQRFLQLLYSLGVEVDECTFIANGIDLSLVMPTSNRVAFLEKQGIVDEGKILCGIAARIHPVKGVELLIDVVEYLDRNDVCILIAGIGERKYVDALKQKVIDKGLSDRMIFLGYVASIYNFYNALDINLLTSFSEGVSYSVMEGGALAKPVVCTDVSGMKALIESGEDGLVVPIGDSEAFARALATLADNRELRLRLGDNLRKKIEIQYTNDVMASHYDKVYQTFFKEG